MKHPMNPNRELLVVGDRVLIKLDSKDERTEAGLMLPKTVMEKAQVQQGRVVAAVRAEELARGAAVHQAYFG